MSNFLGVSPIMRSHRYFQQRGFTLVELLIVIAILGILFSVAMPSYTEYMLKARRADIQQVMLQNSAILERSYSRNGAYPEGFSAQDTEYYKFNYRSDNITYKLTATPKGAQAADNCGTLTINHSGQQTAQTDNCWNG